ncbi:MAG: hypothetical protein HON92_06290 [Planctomycetaceae bacterium]|jgi:hypothetical protein|nr:hypothetical protein [Planctomycetaceae bacterium]MBT4013523.1 hypothetical protein [Planctomycetaceae bacterium]MBT4724348.1 hypothetical protein [Planctomycetaceae bacterium]MBT4845027.1 hypothetical protein [Planctomycetaceae bacterium]MBT5123824.1 hypothetical protein [Planctomycetaceae bacterium]
MLSLRSLTVIMLLVGATVGKPLLAEPPGVAYIFPAGGQRGSSIDFRVGGYYLFAQADFEMLGIGVKGPAQIIPLQKTDWFEGPVIPMPASQAKEDYPKDTGGTLTVAPDAPLGFHYWRVSTSQGITPAMKFIVGDLPEIVEYEIDGDPIPVDVQVPLTINGRIFPREDVDVWQFQAVAGQSYTCEVMSARLGLPLDSRLEIRDPDGRQHAENIDFYGNDSRIRFVANQSGIHQVRIHDIKFGGLQNYVYRLTISDQTLIDHAFPLGGQAGTTIKPELLGQNVPSEAISIKIPQHMSEDGSPNTTIGSYKHPFVFQDYQAGSLSFEISHLREFIESTETAKDVLTTPAVFNGRILQADEVDKWWFSAREGDNLLFDLRAARLGSRLDSIIAIYDKEGKLLKQHDDITNGNTDSSLLMSFKKDGDYYVTVADTVGGRSGKNYAYRLVVDVPVKHAPSFLLTMPGNSLTILRKQIVKVKIKAQRQGGFQGAIELSIEGLPKGITAEGLEIPKGKSEVELTLKCDDQAIIQRVEIRVTGTAVVEVEPKTQVNTTVTPVVATWNPVGDTETVFDTFKLAVGLPTPFKVWGIYNSEYANRGSSYTRKFFIDRGEFKGPIRIMLADTQARHLQGVTGHLLVVPPKDTEFVFQIQLPPWMQVGRTCRSCVMGVAEVTDHDGSRHTVSYSSQEQADQIVCLVAPRLMFVDAEVQTASVQENGSLQVPVRLNRGTLSGKAVIELVVPNHLHGINAESITLPPTATKGALELKFKNVSDIDWNMPITVRATLRDGKAIHIAEDYIEIVR